jgi:hypothetical protein
VRIVVITNNAFLKEKVFCQLWYEGHESPVISRISDIELTWIWETNTDGYSPYFISCENPLKKIPKFVSIVENRCDDANNLLEIFYKPRVEKKKGFFVCLKDMIFKDDISDRLIEWVEIVKLLKAEKIVVYVTDILPQVLRVLKFYESQGFVDINFMKYPKMTTENLTLVQHHQNEMVPYQDCFYKNYNEFDYVVPIDVDELIMPLMDRTWPELMKRILDNKPENAFFDSYEARNTHFYHVDDYLKRKFPERKIFHFLDNTLRNKEPFAVKNAPKSFIPVNNSLVVNNHYPLKCLKGNRSCKDYQIELEYGLLFHYRKTCVGDLDSEDCKNNEIDKAVNDTSLWRFKEEIIKNVEEQVKKLQNFNIENLD